MFEGTELKFNVHIMAAGPNEDYTTVGHMCIHVWVPLLTFNFGDPLYILGMAIVIESNDCSVCSAFDAAFAKLLWPLCLLQATLLNIRTMLQVCTGSTICLLFISRPFCIFCTRSASTCYTMLRPNLISVG